MARAKVSLPPGVGDSFEVFINGVPQARGDDFHLEGRDLVFERELKEEGKLGAARWLSMFFGIAGHYGKNDTVDIVFEYEGRRVVSSGLPIVPEDSA
jgi:hypothetical protein